MEDPCGEWNAVSLVSSSDDDPADGEFAVGGGFASGGNGCNSGLGRYRSDLFIEFSFRYGDLFGASLVAAGGAAAAPPFASLKDVRLGSTVPM